MGRRVMLLPILTALTISCGGSGYLEESNTKEGQPIQVIEPIGYETYSKGDNEYKLILPTYLTLPTLGGLKLEADTKQSNETRACGAVPKEEPTNGGTKETKPAEKPVEQQPKAEPVKVEPRPQPKPVPAPQPKPHPVQVEKPAPKPVAQAQSKQSSNVVGSFNTSHYTAYCTGCSGITASGYDVRNTIYSPEGYRVVATDPRVIPLGTVIRVTYSDGTSFLAKAMDTGGAIKGHKLDILVASNDEAYRLGRVTTTVEIVK